MDCLLNEITLTEPINEPLWDSRQKEVSWKEKCPSFAEFEEECAEDDVFVKKVINTTTEPDCEIVPGKTETIQLLISANANYTEFECDAENINFENTLMFQVSKTLLQVSNKHNFVRYAI